MADNRVAYGLAKKYGIDTSGMSPKEVWEALKKKGVTPENVSDGAYNSQQDMPFKRANPKTQKIERPKDEIKMHNYVLNDEDKKVVDNIRKGDYYSKEELKQLPLFKKMDEVAKQIRLEVGKEIGIEDGDTSSIETPERENKESNFLMILLTEPARQELDRIRLRKNLR